jgi:hypothetical protein
MDNQVWIVVTGDPLMGYTFHGPFAEHEDAMRYAEGINDEWHVAPVFPAEDD